MRIAAERLLVELGGDGLDVGGCSVLPSAPELAVVEASRRAGAPVRLTHHALWKGGARQLPIDDDRVLSWIRSHIGDIGDPDERMGACFRLAEESVTRRLWSRAGRDLEDERKDRAAIGRQARKLGVEAAPLATVPPWFEAVVGTSSRRKQARAYAEGARDDQVVHRAIAAWGLLETARELRMDDVPASIEEVSTALLHLGRDPVGYVRLLALTASEWLVRVGIEDHADVCAPLVGQLDEAGVAWSSPA
ncbi:MAG: hypothetical protein KC621_01345 [Myxococcales bacterium]|nr:hypothetical protein [Myxococcales bacterium]